MGSPSAPHDVTELLAAWGRGERQALDRLIPLVHDELRKLGRAHLARERQGHTLQATALVHEAYLGLLGQRRPPTRCRRQFFGVASLLMRRILLQYEARRRAGKRDPGARSAEVAASQASSPEDVLALEGALATLRDADPRQARVVALRFFAGYSVAETADRLGISPATVKREWRMARAWLRAALVGVEDCDAEPGAPDRMLSIEPKA